MLKCAMFFDNSIMNKYIYMYMKCLNGTRTKNFFHYRKEGVKCIKIMRLLIVKYVVGVEAKSL